MAASSHPQDIAVSIATARTLKARYEWQMLDPEAFVLDYIARAQSAPDRSNIVRAYLGRLRKALADPNAPDREQASAEVWRFIYCLAFVRYREQVDEVAQAAMLLVLDKLESCRCDETFMEFVMWKVRAAATDQLRFERQRTRLAVVVAQSDLNSAASNEADSLDQADEPWDLLPDHGPGVEESVLRSECAHEVVAAILRLGNANQREVLLVDLGEGLDDESLARRLGTSPGNVRKLRHDGRKRLQLDAALQRYMRDAFERGEVLA